MYLYYTLALASTVLIWYADNGEQDQCVHAHAALGLGIWDFALSNNVLLIHTIYVLDGVELSSSANHPLRDFFLGSVYALMSRLYFS